MNGQHQQERQVLDQSSREGIGQLLEIDADRRLVLTMKDTDIISKVFAAALFLQH